MDDHGRREGYARRRSQREQRAKAAPRDARRPLTIPWVPILSAVLALVVIAIVFVLFAMGQPQSVVSAPRPVATETVAPAAEATPAAAITSAPAQPTAIETAAPAPAPKPKPKSTTPELMAHLPSGTRQIVIITGTRIGSNSGTLAVYNLDGGHWTQVLSTTANFGKNGLVDGEKRTSGHLQTPTGLWSLGTFAFGLHASAPSGTKIPYRHITNNSWWSSERTTYNTWVESKAKVSGEHLADADPQYQYAINTGYNSLPNKRVMGRGTAIFIHCFEPPGNSLGKFTHGCVAIDPAQMVKLFQLLDPARRPTCATGTLQKGSSTAIWSY